MAYLDENNKFANQTNLGWTFAFEANGKYPIIANRIFATKAGAENFIANNATAIPGLILRVIEDTTVSNNGAYLVEKNGESGLKLTRIVTGNLDISGKMVDIVLATDGKFYDIKECTLTDGTYTPNEGAVAIDDSAVDEAGKYLHLELGNDDVYINSADLISLDDYYTKDLIGELLSDLDSSLSDYTDTKVEDLSVYIKEYVDDSIDEFKEYVDASLNSLKDYIDEQDEALANEITTINSSIEEIKEVILGISDDISILDVSVNKLGETVSELGETVEDISSRLANGVVTSVSTTTDYVHVEPENGDVAINLDIVDATEAEFQNISNNGIATVGYVEERLDTFNWIEVEDTINPEISGDSEGSAQAVQTSDESISTNVSETLHAESLSVISTGGDVTLN